MIELAIKGGDKIKRAAIRKAIRWVTENRLNINKGIRINVRFKKGIDHYGEAYWVSPSSYNSRSFTIVLNEELITLDNAKLFYETIMHEMVHVWQQANRTSRFTLNRNQNKYQVFWKGIEMTNTPYSRQPWERQAFRMESKLAEDFMATL